MKQQNGSTNLSPETIELRLKDLIAEGRMPKFAQVMKALAKGSTSKSMMEGTIVPFQKSWYVVTGGEMVKMEWRFEPMLKADVKYYSSEEVKARGMRWVTIRGSRVLLQGTADGGWVVVGGAGGKLNHKLEEWQDQWTKAILGQATPQTETGKPPPAWHVFVYAQDFPHNPAIPKQTLYVWDLLQSIIDETQAQAESSGAQYGVFLIPEISQVDQTTYQVEAGKYSNKWDMSATPWDISAPNKAMVEMYTTKQIPVLDMLPALASYAANSNEDLYFPKNKHFSPEGHRVAAEYLCDWLMDSSLVEP